MCYDAIYTHALKHAIGSFLMHSYGLLTILYRFSSGTNLLHLASYPWSKSNYNNSTHTKKYNFNWFQAFSICEQVGIRGRKTLLSWSHRYTVTMALSASPFGISCKVQHQQISPELLSIWFSTTPSATFFISIIW